MSGPRFVAAAVAILLLCEAPVLLGQSASDTAVSEQSSRYTLRDISERGSPLRVAGEVTFQAGAAVLKYQVEAAIRNVSKKKVLSWSVGFRTSDGILNFNRSDDYFFTEDVLTPGVLEGVHSGPIRLVAQPRDELPTAEQGDASGHTVTATAEVEFVQFQDGSTWGDSDTEAKAFAYRIATLHKLESIQKAYSEQGERAFWDALAEPTMLASIERVETDCRASNDSLNCALGAIQKMLDTGAHRGFLEKP